MSTLYAITEFVQYAPTVQAGLFDTAEAKLKDFNSVLVVGGSSVISLLFIIAAWRAKGALAGILSAGLVMFVFYYFLYHPKDGADLIDEEMNSAPAVQHFVAGD